MIKKALLIVSFGVALKESREKTLNLYARDVKTNFLTYDVFTAYLSHRMIEKIKRREDVMIEDPIKALANLSQIGYDEVWVQSLGLIYGETFQRLETDIYTYQDKFKKIGFIHPMLHESSDYGQIAKLITQDIVLNKKKEALVFVGHGTHGSGQAFYLQLSESLEKLDANTNQLLKS